eukprot:g12251.t1
MGRLFAARQARSVELDKSAPPDTSAKQLSVLAKAAAQVAKEQEEQRLLNLLNEEAKSFLPDFTKGALVPVRGSFLGGEEGLLRPAGYEISSFGQNQFEHGFSGSCFSSSYRQAGAHASNFFGGATLGGELEDDYDFRRVEPSAGYGPGSSSNLLPIEDAAGYFSSTTSLAVPQLPDRLGGALISSKAGVFEVVPAGKEDSVLNPVIAAPNKGVLQCFTANHVEDADDELLNLLESPAKMKPLKPFPKDEEAQKAVDNPIPESPSIVLPQQISWSDVVRAMKKAKNNGLPSAQFPGAKPAEGDSDEESAPIPEAKSGKVERDPFNFDSEITTQAPASVKQYKQQFLLRYVDLMRALNLSSKRINTTPDSFEALFKAFWVCGDFSRSKVQYFSWIKSYIQKVLHFSPQLQSSYSKYFRILSKAKPAMSQEAAIRLSTLIQIIQACEESMDFVMIRTKKKNTMGTNMPISVSMVIRHIIACWFAFLRPNESNTTCRAVSYSAGRWNVRYLIPHRKNSQRQPVALDMTCCCQYTPWVKPPICPVHCTTDTQWKIMNTYVDDDEWRQAIRHLVFHAGFPLTVKNCRHKWGSYSVRIGGAQSARDAGTKEDVIRKIGWWSSEKTSQHYQCFASTCADSIAIQWPIRTAVLFAPSTRSNS